MKKFYGIYVCLLSFFVNSFAQETNLRGIIAAAAVLTVGSMGQVASANVGENLDVSAKRISTRFSRDESNQGNSDSRRGGHHGSLSTRHCRNGHTSRTHAPSGHRSTHKPAKE